MTKATGRGVSALLVTLVMVAMAGCAGFDAARVPPIEAAGEQPLPGKVVWHDLLTEDPAAARRFYGELFGWEFRRVSLGLGQNYTVIEREGRLIGGMIDARGIRRDGNVSRWIPVLSVADIESAVAAAEANGGSVFQVPIEIPQRGSVAVIGDPQGSVLTLFQPGAGDLPDRVPEAGDWLWNEIWTSDPEATLAFYRALVPTFEVEEIDTGQGETYRILNANGQPRVGVLRNPVNDIADTWMAYVKVGDPAAKVMSAQALGGTVLMPPRAYPRRGEIAILNDPSGAGFLIQSWQP